MKWTGENREYTVEQDLRQHLETECTKLAIVKLLIILFFKGDQNLISYNNKHVYTY